jgi:SAM-dependent methyltransferase
LAVQTASQFNPGIRFLEGDFSDQQFLSGLGKFEIVLLVNALHHVFSDAFDEELGEVDVQAGKQAVLRTFNQILPCIKPGGYLLLFDGLEPSGDPQQPVDIRFLNRRALEDFYQFAREYQPFRIRFKTLPQEDCIQLSLHDFTRYITKMIFLGKPLWPRERLESYQYFNEHEFRDMLAANHLQIREWQLISVDDQRWQDAVEILTPGIDFPAEHVLIIAQKPGKQ